MNINIKNKWIEALRSGKYTQIKNVLRLNDCFCVQGVLCDLYSKSHNVKWELEQGISNEYEKVFSICSAATSVPIDILNWAELSKNDSNMLRILNMNDISLNSFNEIANYIEKNF